MTDVTAEPTDAPPAKSKRGLVVGLVLLLAAAGGSYFAASKAFSPTHATAEGTQNETADDSSDPAADTDIAFVALDPMLVSLSGDERHLRFVAQVEVAPGQQDGVAALMPRLVDTLQDYLRAVGSDQLGEADALLRLRSQMLRRLQMVAGPDRIRDLLIMEFVLN